MTRGRAACYTSKLAGRAEHLNLERPRSCRNSEGLRRVISLSIVTEKIQALTLASRIDSIAEATAAAAQVANRLGFGDEALFGIDMAVREAVTNAVMHGNSQDEGKSVEVTFDDSPGELTITVRDEGTGFDPERVADPTAEQNLLKTSGRGILFMRNFMDAVEYARHPKGGTIVRMTKRR